MSGAGGTRRSRFVPDSTGVSALAFPTATLLLAACTVGLSGPASAQQDVPTPTPQDVQVRPEALPDTITLPQHQEVLRVDPEVLRRAAGGQATPNLPTETVVAARVPGGVREIEMAGMEAATTGAEGVEARPGRLLQLPFRYRVPAADRSRALYLTPVVDRRSGRLRYDPGEDAFVGFLLLGVQDSLHPRRRDSLSDPIHFQVDVEEGETSPRTLRLGHTNLPFREVGIRARTPGDSLAVTVRTTFHPEGERFRLPVEVPELTLHPSPGRVPGLGVEAATLIVGVGAEMGDRPVTVTLTADRGDPDPHSVTVAGGPEEVSFRSTGLGEATVTARAARLGTARARVTFFFPTGYLLAALAGGLIGGLLSGWRGEEESSLGELAVDGLQGVLAGTLVAAAYHVGLNVLQVQPDAAYGELLTFVLAGLGGFAGDAALTKWLSLPSRLPAGSE